MEKSFLLASWPLIRGPRRGPAGARRQTRGPRPPGPTLRLTPGWPGYHDISRPAGPGVSGALQSAQVAGYGNSVGNSLDVQVSRDRIAIEPGTSVASARSGGAMADVGSQGITVRVDAGPAGFAEQRLGGVSGITQRATVMTDGVVLQNNARLTVHMAPGASAMNPALQTLRTLVGPR